MAENLMQTKSVPEKFLDENGQLKTDILLQSYLELEKKLSRMVCLPSQSSSEEEKREFSRLLRIVRQTTEGILGTVRSRNIKE